MQLFDWTRRGFIAVLGAAALSGLAPALQAQTPPGVLIVGQIAEPKALDPAAVAVGLGRIVALYYRASTLYHIR